MPLKERIAHDMKQALRARDEARLRAIRMLQAAIQRQEIDTRTTLDDGAVSATVQKLIKQSQDAIEQFTKGGRDDLVAREKADIAAWQAYLPEQLSDEALAKLVADAISETGATSIKDIGKVMGALKAKVQGRADMAKVSAAVKANLGSP